MHIHNARRHMHTINITTIQSSSSHNQPSNLLSFFSAALRVTAAASTYESMRLDGLIFLRILNLCF